MRVSTILDPRRLIWLTLLGALLGLGHVATTSWWAEAGSPRASTRIGAGGAPAPPSGGEAREAADPWERSPSGARLDSGYGPGEERPGLLP